MGGQTFAKYITTTQTETQQATVAKWGFVASINATGMFKDKYATDTEPADGEDDGVSVKASEAKVAPGTSGSMKIVFSGSAETDAKVTFNTTGTWSDVYLSDGSKTYYPVKWTLQDGTKTPEVKNGTLADVKTALEENSGYYNAGDDAIGKDYTLSWVWDFNVAGNIEVKNFATTADQTDVLSYDEADTRLGLIANDASAASFTYKPAGSDTETTDKYTCGLAINFSLQITIEQVD